MLRAPRRDFILSGRRHGGHAQAAGTRQSGPRLARLEPGRSCRAGASSATLATRSQASEISQAIEKLTGRKIKTGFPFAWKAGFYVRERIALSRQRRLLQLRQESCQQADQRQESADLIHKENIGHVSQLAQQCRANTTHAERETEEQTRHGADLARHQFLREHQNCREGRRQDHADDDGQYASPEQVGIWQHQRERRHTQDRYPDHQFAADAVTDRAADHGADGDRKQEHEQMNLCILHRQLEFADQIKREVARQAGHVKVLGKDQQQQDADRLDHLLARQLDITGGLLLRLGLAGQLLALIPVTDLTQHDDGNQRCNGEPRDAALSAGDDDPCRQPDAMRATREASGWKTEEPVPTSAAATSSTPKFGATDSSSKPHKVEPMPMASEYGLGCLSVYSPTSGCNSEAVT